jgi:DMSO/TMAO reductase YedYZ molybdopterin-dependent catalytic subunit
VSDSVARVVDRVEAVRDDALEQPVHGQRTGAVLGLMLLAAFSICLVTGLWSHYAQHPTSWFTWPARPAGLYRVSQGAHVVTGLMTVPLLLAKLYAMWPKLFKRPPVRSVTHAAERLMLLPLVAASLFLLHTGVANIAHWYPWRLYFPSAHWWAAWLLVGSLLTHALIKAPIVRREFWPADADTSDVTAAAAAGARPRRAFIAGTVATAAVVGFTSVGQTFAPLRRFIALAPRDPEVGPQGIPVNKSAVSARVIESATTPDYRLSVEGRVDQSLEFSVDELRAMGQHSAELPISCVEGWSASAVWTGIRLRDLVAAAGGAPDAAVMVESLQPSGRYRTSEINATVVQDPDTLLALQINGEDLHLDHGAPVRLICPNRPGVLQTKWVARVEVL